ncbi:hypothetical protein C0075_00110 [Rhizobium sp. KAs_5_22]|nr:hypothetical protein C0075_00110 [Rhizobium sp. KAs_5_22]
MWTSTGQSTVVGTEYLLLLKRAVQVFDIEVESNASRRTTDTMDETAALGFGHLPDRLRGSSG